MKKLLVTTKPSPALQQGGMALFVVLVLVLVMTVLITQLVFVTKVEERISFNRQGYVKLSYALQSGARQVLQSLSTDLMEDLGYFDEELSEDGLPLSGSGSGTATTSGGGASLPGGIDLGVSPTAGGGSGGGGGGAGGAAGENSQRVDTRHDSWAYPLQDSVDQVQITGSVIDGESCIDLNYIFELASLEEDLEDDPDDLEELGEEAQAAAEAAGLGDLLEEEEEEYEAPDQETVDEAEFMIQRLIEAVIDYNMEFGFDYYDVPDAVTAASSIVSMVYSRAMEEETRRIRSLDSIRELEGVSWELFDGPIDPEEEDLEEGDFEEDLFATMNQEIPGAGELLQQAGFELLDGGVSQLPKPIGLRHVLTTNSSGKVNLNTARPEVLIALIRSFEDFDEAKEISWMIYEHGNQYQELEEGEEETVTSTINEFGLEEEEAEEFQHFTKIDQLGHVDETWSEGGAGEESVLELLKQDLEDHCVFASNYFTATIEGSHEDRALSGRIVCARKDQHIVVLSWREVRR